MARQPFFVMAVTERQPDGTSETIAYVPLDVRESSDLLLTSQVSENPLEEGSVVGDHVINDPALISVAGLVSEHPAGLATSTPQTTTSGQILPGSRAQSCYAVLKETRDKKRPLTVVNELGVFDDMMITSLSFPRTKEKGGDAIWFALDLKQVEIVESESSSLPPGAVAKVKRRRKITKARQTPRQNELAARRAKESFTGKTSTKTPTTANSNAAGSKGGAFSAASGGAR